MPFPYEEFDLSAIKTYPLKSRPSKVRAEDFGRPFRPGSGVAGLIESLPAILAGTGLRDVVRALTDARKARRGIAWAFGGHVVKVGLGPVLIDLMERGFVSALATNGAGLIHDFEIALAGATSEDVAGVLGSGTFGMADETGRLLNGAINEGVAAGLGIGQSVGRFLAGHHPQYEGASIAAAASRLNIPLTVHVAIGTDIIHMHPSASGSALGEGSLRDFRYFATVIAGLAGGVFLNCGSAVVLPEVFLKAVSVARNQGRVLDGLVTVNLDFARHYRPQVNVVERPTAGVGRGYSLVGHHEILIPLIAAALVESE